MREVGVDWSEESLYTSVVRCPDGVGERWEDNPGVDEGKNGEDGDEMEKTEARHDDKRDRGKNEKTTEEYRSEEDEFKGIA